MPIPRKASPSPARAVSASHRLETGRAPLPQKLANTRANMPAVATAAAFGKQNISQAPTPRALECVRPLPTSAVVARQVSAARGCPAAASPMCCRERSQRSGVWQKLLDDSGQGTACFPELLAARGGLHPSEHDGDPPDAEADADRSRRDCCSSRRSVYNVTGLLSSFATVVICPVLLRPWM
jgi:hypothetical protein